MSRKVKEWIGKTDDTQAPPRVRLRVFQREKGICHISGRKIRAGDHYQIEHKIAIINGGQNRESNLFPALIGPHKEKTKADVKEKAKVAAKAKANLGIKSAPARPINSAGFQPTEKAVERAAGKTKEPLFANLGPPGIARRFAAETPPARKGK